MINPRLPSMVTAAAASLQLRNQGVGRAGPVSEQRARRLKHAPGIEPMEIGRKLLERRSDS